MGIVISRKDLYENVWSTPLTQLGKEFGVSDQAVGKACRRANIPRPGAGYWAKVKAGKQTHKMPLPPRFPGQEETIYIGQQDGIRRTDDEILEQIPTPPVFDEDMSILHERVKKIVGKVPYPQTKTKTHPIIQTFLTQDGERKREYEQKGYSWYAPRYDSPIERRRLRILNAIFLALRGQGCKPSMRTSQYDYENRTAYVMVGYQNVEFELKAIESKRRSKSESVKSPSRLRFSISTHSDFPNIESLWEDTEDMKIESQLSDIVVALLMSAEAQYRGHLYRYYECEVQHRNDLIERRHQAILEQEREEREAIEQEKRERFEKLLSEAAAYNQASQIRQYVHAVIEQTNDVDMSHITEWADWALEKADEIDPVVTASYLN